MTRNPFHGAVIPEEFPYFTNFVNTNSILWWISARTYSIDLPLGAVDSYLKSSFVAKIWGMLVNGKNSIGVGKLAYCSRFLRVFKRIEGESLNRKPLATEVWTLVLGQVF